MPQSTWISCFRNRRAKWEWFPAEVSWLIIPLKKKMEQWNTQSETRADRNFCFTSKITPDSQDLRKIGLKNLDLPYPTPKSSVKAPSRFLVKVLPFSQHLVENIPEKESHAKVKQMIKSRIFTWCAANFFCLTGSFYWTWLKKADLQKNKEMCVMYLCFLKVWKALSLPKLDRLSVAGWNGTEWMKPETEGESWNG